MDNALPLSARVAVALRARILRGQVLPGERLGTEAGLCEQFGVSRATVRAALAQLADEGLLHARRGAGTFVVDTLPPGATATAEVIGFTGLLEDLWAQAEWTAADGHRRDELAADPVLAAELDVAPGSQVVRFTRILTVDVHPFASVEDLLPAGVAEIVDEEMLATNGSMLRALDKAGLAVESATQWLSPVVGAEQAVALGCRPDEPVLSATGLVVGVAGRPLDRYRLWFGPTYRIQMRFVKGR